MLEADRPTDEETTVDMKFAVGFGNMLYLSLGDEDEHQALVLVQLKTFSVMCRRIDHTTTVLSPLASKIDNTSSYTAFMMKMINDQSAYVWGKETHRDDRVADELKEYRLHTRLSNQLANW